MKRSEQEFKNTWATEDLFTSDESWETAFNSLPQAMERLKAFEGKLGESGKNIYDYLVLSEEIGVELVGVYAYAMLKNDEESGVSKYQGYYGKAIGMYSEFGAATAFDRPELIAISEETLEGFYKKCPELEIFRNHLTRLRLYRAHTLSAECEALLASAGEATGAPKIISSVFRDADLKFPDITDKDGNPLKVTQATYIKHLESTDRDIRRQAFESVYHSYEKFINTTAALVNAQVKQLTFYTKARKFGSNLERALFANEVPTEVYHQLLKSVGDNLPSLHKYIALRKKTLGLEELHMYDMYVPLVAEENIEIKYEEAKEMCLESLAVLGEDYIGILKEGFGNRWIDVYENDSKRSGAYSMGIRPHPYVLHNYNDTLDSAFTLAHEMGHAIHSYLSIKNQRPTYDDYVIFVAEVASTFNEILMTKHLLSKTTDKKKRAYIINHMLEQFRGTIYRQTMFAEFELEISKYSEKGESLTAETLNSMYLELNKKYYGENVVSDREIAFEWARIPHFYLNFYVYQYATGFAAAIALAEKVLAEGKPAVEGYLEFLSSGRIADPITLLKKAGVDMASPQPVNSALKMFGELVDELEELLK